MNEVWLIFHYVCKIHYVILTKLKSSSLCIFLAQKYLMFPLIVLYNRL